MTELIRTELAADGVLTATIDMPDRSMNVFSKALMDAIEALQDKVDASSDIASVVLTSGKSSFLAGADLPMVQGFANSARSATTEQMFALCGRLGRLFVRLEASAKPWVAAVNGTALGGGLELAMACRVRLVSDAPRTALGVPEVRWGLLPGAGGTQRLPRLVGFKPAMALLLTGKSLDADSAVAAGIFDAKVAADKLLATAQVRARALQGQPYDAARKFAYLAQTDVPAHSDSAARQVALDHGVADADLDIYPAYLAITHSVLLGARLPLHQATDVEMRQFLKLMFNPVAGNMIGTLFINRQRADKAWRPPEGLRLMQVGVGALSDANALWAQALSKSRLAHAPDPTLPADTLALTDSHGTRLVVSVACLNAAGQKQSAGPLAVMCPKGPYGRVLEIINAVDADMPTLAALAAALQAMAYRSSGQASVLQALASITAGTEGARLQSQASAAQQYLARGHIIEPEFFDVAACTAGVFPAWSGGPFTWVSQHSESLAA